jgi:hypothetical protein
LSSAANAAPTSSSASASSSNEFGRERLHGVLGVGDAEPRALDALIPRLGCLPAGNGEPLLNLASLRRGSATPLELRELLGCVDGRLLRCAGLRLELADSGVRLFALLDEPGQFFAHGAFGHRG